jgi:hypothetical protein
VQRNQSRLADYRPVRRLGSVSADESSFDEEMVRSLFGAPSADAMLVFGAPEEDEPANA